MEESQPLTGVRVMALTAHRDERGAFTELHRLSWHDSPPPLQWNAVASEANVLRGVHVHLRHWDYFFLVSGEMRFGLHDMRPESPSYRGSVLLTLRGASPSGICVPPGVAHGFCYTEPSLHVYAVSEYFDPADELGCRWDCPELGLAWPCTRPKLSRRDEEAGGYAGLAAQLARSKEKRA
jgi:dTDP-4-dehydrorhamnose 3,5-epimerase